MSSAAMLALGLDFGTESVRALLVDLAGVQRGAAVSNYRRGQITRELPGSNQKLPHDYAFQDPADWIESAGVSVREAMREADASPKNVIGIGVDFTSCTMMPALADGTPLCQVGQLRSEMFAWPKLWKHHGAKSQTDRINQLARERNEPWLARYGQIIGLEWFFPKILETLEEAPHVYDATEVWLEAGDWFVWQLTSGPAEQLPRSTCQAGYKAMWNGKTGYPSSDFFGALHPKMASVVSEKMPGRRIAPGEVAGGLCEKMADLMGLAAGTPVSAAIIDAHAGVPGAGVCEPDTLVMVMGTSSCHMLNSRVEKLVPGVAGVVEGGILPGYYGYETGQAAVGDAFDWVRNLLGHDDFESLVAAARKVPAGSEGVMCVDWFNGCRTPLMDGSLKGAFTGLTLNHHSEHLFRAVLEGTSFGLRWIVDVLRDGGVPVERFVATGGLPHHNTLLAQITADVLNEPVVVHPSKQGPALGAAVLGVIAAGESRSGFATFDDAIKSMAAADGSTPERTPIIYEPQADTVKRYDDAYARYRSLAATLAG